MAKALLLNLINVHRLTMERKFKTYERIPEKVINAVHQQVHQEMTG
jgi:hypothetical protein